MFESKAKDLSQYIFEELNDFMVEAKDIKIRTFNSFSMIFRKDAVGTKLRIKLKHNDQTVVHDMIFEHQFQKRNTLATIKHMIGRLLNHLTILQVY